MTSIEQLRFANDLRDLVGVRTKLHRRGKHLTGLCPFHSERTPSFIVDDRPDGRFYCFGCGAHGDVIDWIERTEGVTTGEAIRRLGGDPTDRPEPPPPKVDPAWQHADIGRRFKGLALRHWNAVESVRRLESVLAGDSRMEDPAWDQLAESYRERDDTERLLRGLFDKRGFVPWQVWLEVCLLALDDGADPLPWPEVWAQRLRRHVTPDDGFADVWAANIRRGQQFDACGDEWQRDLFPKPEAA